MSSLHIQCRQYIVGTHLAHGHSVAVLLRPTRRHGPRLCDRLVSKPASTNRARPGIVPGAQSRRSPPPTQSDLDFPAQQILSALEVVAWFCATGLQLWAFSLAHQQYRKSQHCTLQEEAEYSAGEATPVAQATWSDHVSASPSLMTQFAVFAVILAAVFGRARSWLSHGR